jgi:hypothetical protein
VDLAGFLGFFALKFSFAQISSSSDQQYFPDSLTPARIRLKKEMARPQGEL